MRLLVVEDEKEIADGIRAIVENANYKVDCEYDGISGLDNILILQSITISRYMFHFYVKS